MLLCDQITFGGYPRPFHISPDILTSHAFICGGTGTGKSTLLVNLLSELACEGGAFAFLDPHGTAAAELLDRIPRRRTRDLIYIRPADLERPIGLNPLAHVHRDGRHLVASNVTDIFKNQYSYSWGPNLENLLKFSARTLLEVEEATLLWIARLIRDRIWRNGLLRNISDFSIDEITVHDFWTEEFDKKPAREREVMITSLQNKIGILSLSPPLAYSLGQPESAFSIKDVMDKGHILIADLSDMGTAEANIYGSLLTTLFQVEAMKREKTTPFILALDEAHRFTTDSLTSILSEGRKFGLGLLLVSQYLEQWEKQQKSSIFSNCSTSVIFRLGGEDAQAVEKHLAGAFPQSALTDLAPYNAVVRCTRHPHVTEPFRGITRPPIESRSRRNTLIRISRERYGTRRSTVERQISRVLRGRFGRKRPN